MTEHVKKTATEKPLAEAILGSAHQFWLAGLGAFVKAEAEGSKLFEDLVKEGEAIELRRRKEIEKQSEEIRTRANEAWDRFEQGFQERVSRSLGRLGIATHEELQELRRLIENLNARVSVLSESQGPAGKQTTGKNG